MRILAKVFDRVAETVKSFFYVRAPVLSVKVVAECSPFIRIAQGFTGRRKKQFAVFVKVIKAGKELSLKLIPKYIYRDEEAVL